MNDNFKEQKDFLLSIKHEISLLHQQIDYLIRNEKALGLLDLDVMMNRTHKIYDLMCGVEVGSGECGIMNAECGIEEEKVEEKVEQKVEQEEAKVEVKEEVKVEEKEEVKEDDEEIDNAIGDALLSAFLDFKKDSEEEKPKEVPVEEPNYGFVFAFNPEEVPSEQSHEEEKQPKQEDEKTTLMKKDTLTIVPIESVVQIDDEEITNEVIQAPATIGEKLQQEEDHSLAAKLQHVTDLRAAIGMNDKYLFVNELFGGNKDKYNKTLENLNDLKTLNGALIYMNELRIELQWNSSNEAYQKLLHLVHRKFD